MKFRAGPIVAWAALSGVLCAQTAQSEPLSLKLSREIEAPAPAQVTPGTAATTPATQPAGREVRGALILRADRVEGDDKRITAFGNVELRGRHETVLADELSYDIESQTIYGDGNVVLRRNFDWITGPQL